MKYSQKSLLYKVLKNIKDNNLIEKGDRIIVALSGGPDSVCLFDILYKLKEQIDFSLSACHFNHKMRGRASEADEKFVLKLCKDRGVECIVDSAKTKILNEESARIARYTFFEKILEERRGAKIALAHNSDDLIETFFLRVARGTGIRGLKSIPLRRKNFIRPLLYIEKKMIVDYLKEQGLKYQIDKTNFDTTITRNFIRLKIMPFFREINPNFIESGVSMIKSLNEDFELISTISSEKYKKCIVEESPNQIILDRNCFLTNHISIMKQILFGSIAKIAGTATDITSKHIDEVIDIIAKGEGKKHKLLPHSLLIELKSGKIHICKKN